MNDRSGSENIPVGPHDPLAALRVANYRRFALGFLFGSTGLQVMNTAVAWEIWVRTHDPLSLGAVGLCRALPVVLLALPAGHAADLFDRRSIVAWTQVGFACIAACFAALSYANAPVWGFYLVLLASACVRAFNGPARQSFLPLIVPHSIFQNVVAYQSGIFQAAAIAGPITAGYLMNGTTTFWPIYLLTCAACLIFAVAVRTTRPAPAPRAAGGLTASSMLAGLDHMWRERPVFAAILLDMLAVLFGGATGLLPMYADDILHGDASLLGWLRAAPYFGALAMAAWLAFRPDFKRAGPVLLWSVVAFALATIVFGLSQVWWLSILALAVAGAADNISVVVRHVLVQMRTPNTLRGRVGAVNSMFIECSNELGSFESGLVAKFFGPVASVVSGGIGTLVVIGGIALAFPQLRQLRRIRPLREPDLDPS
ncbi:MAG: MFS transporter [Phycisphaerales bacterium]